MRCSFVIFAALVLAAGLNAQSGRSYPPDRIWWGAGQGGNFPWSEEYDNADGLTSILNAKGAVHTEGHAFFEALGTNDRACITCHQPSNAMSVSTASLKQRWKDTSGKDPVFAAIDGSNCPSLPQAAVSSHSLLLNRGLFRIFLQWPPKDITPDFRIEVVKDPTGCNTDPVYGMKGGRPAISVYRRARVAANLSYVTGLMADGREATLESQAANAALGHEQATIPPTPEQLRQIADFERQLYAAQSADIRGGLLTEADGPELLGPENLAQGKAGVTGGKTLSFAAWTAPRARIEGLQKEFRMSAARGSALFSARCATCHNEQAAPAAKDIAMDIGTTNRTDLAELPLFKVTCAGRAAPIYTSDPGRALITGKCADVGAIVTQQLRGLAARPPYFSNGSAETLQDVVNYYDRRYQIGYTDREKQDLVNFLKVL